MGCNDNDTQNSNNTVNPFKTFWMAGFECADHLNAFGHRVDLINETGHLRFVGDDYKRLSLFGIKTVREGIRWSFAEQSPYRYNFTEVEQLIIAAKENNIQQIWDLCHFGFPDDLTPLHPMFARRFAALCSAFVLFFRRINPSGVLIITPINEVSFLSWLGGDVRGTAPYCIRQGWEVKYHLMKAYIEGIEAIRQIDSAVRILTTEPLVNIVPPLNADPNQFAEAVRLNEDQFQVTDMLSGRICPELKGKPEYLDILGYNYYYNNQWIIGTGDVLPWRNETNDERFLPLSKLLSVVYQRYKRPIVLSETSHPREDRPLWIKMLADECAAVLSSGLPFFGVCWYPMIDRPDWDNTNIWHESGLWDGASTPDEIRRILHKPSAAAFMNAQARLKAAFSLI
ncbi:MAG: amine oxidase [Ferruginibacter sp.]|nr:amine oxidase [Ferruginibacter sp.]